MALPIPTLSQRRVQERNHGPRAFRWWYHSLMDYMLAHPEATQREIALHFRRTENWVSLIINSDMFQAVFAQRREQLRQSADLAILAKTAKIANTGLDLILDKMEKKRDSIPIETIADITNSALDRLGYNAKPAAASGSTVHVNVAASAQANVAVPVPLSALEQARARLREAEAVKASGPLLIESKPVEQPEPVDKVEVSDAPAS